MNKTTVSKMIFGAVLLLFTACTQDELVEQGNTLPDGEYPLQIGSVSITAEASEEPWTRVTEKPDGSGSVWQPDDAITVSLDGETATYTYDGSAWTSDALLYWKNTQTAEVTAWYPATDGVVNLSDQDRNGLTYVLRGTGTGNHQSPVSLGFTHQLAKVRVVLSGTQASQVNAVEVYGITACNHRQGSLSYNASNTGWIKTKQQTYAGGTECWEANVVPGVEINRVKVNGIEATITTSLTPVVAALNTIDLTVGSLVPNAAKAIDLTGGKNYVYRMQDNAEWKASAEYSYAVAIR